MDSRVQTTRAIGEAIAAATRPPPVWLEASTATIYADTYGPANDENGTLGGHEPDVPDTWQFSIDVARAWEQAALEAQTPGTRLVLMRSAITMSPDRGGPFDVLLGLVRRGLGGTSGHGRQYVSWMRTETELVLKSRRVIPGRLLADGFEFRWPRWPDAARELCARRRGA